MGTLPFGVGLRNGGAVTSRRADRAPGWCRAGGGLLGGKGPAGRFVGSQLLASAITRLWSCFHTHSNDAEGTKYIVITGPGVVVGDVGHQIHPHNSAGDD